MNFLSAKSGRILKGRWNEILFALVLISTENIRPISIGLAFGMSEGAVKG